MRLILQQGLSVVAVSGFEIRLALDLGFPGERIFFNGNGKRRWEMRLAAMNKCIMNVDSVFNARQLVEVVRELDAEVDVTIRLNVDIETQVHPYLQTVSKNSKFGVINDDFRSVLHILSPEKRVRVVGLHCHLGSTIDDVSVFSKLFVLLEKTVNDNLDMLSQVRVINVGGGLGINYRRDDDASSAPSISDLSGALPDNSPFTIMVEPGRSLVGDTGVLITQVLGVKSTDSKTFVVVDGSMTELIRPALYRAYHTILPVVKRRCEGEESATVDFVGPVCESGDWLGKDRTVCPMPQEGDLFAVMDAGAYCMAMASNYNLRARPAEVLVEGASARLIQARESYEDVVRKQFFTSSHNSSSSSSSPISIKKTSRELNLSCDDLLYTDSSSSSSPSQSSSLSSSIADTPMSTFGQSAVSPS